MIFPAHCKVVGCAAGTPCGDRVYFLTEYLIRETGAGCEVVAVETDPEETGVMRRVVRTRVLAGPGEVCRYPERVQLHDRTFLVERAAESGYRCTVFTGHDEHTTFVMDPDLAGFLRIHVYDIEPPRPHLSATLRDLERCGLFGDLEVIFEHHVQDIRSLDADVYPCRAAGFARTLDADALHGGERIAGCQTGAQIARECYGDAFELENICPLASVDREPFIARCCRNERVGAGVWNGQRGTVVHWGASPREIALAALDLIRTWRTDAPHRGG